MDIAGRRATEAALKFAPLVFVRPGELRKAEWSEMELAGAGVENPGAQDETAAAAYRAARDASSRDLCGSLSP